MLALVDTDENYGSPSNETKERTARTLAALDTEKTRRWEYLKVARRARRLRRGKRKPGQRLELLLSHSEFRLLFALVERADADLSNSFPSAETLAEQEGWSLKMVKVTLAALVDKGWLVQHDHDKAKVNQFCVPDGAISPYARGWEGPLP